MHHVYLKLRILRNERGLSQTNVAEDLGLSLTGYAKIERGETELTVARLYQIADYYKISIMQILEINEPSDLNETFKDKEISYLKQINQLLLEKLAKKDESK